MGGTAGIVVGGFWSSFWLPKINLKHAVELFLVLWEFKITKLWVSRGTAQPFHHKQEKKMLWTVDSQA